MSEVEDTNTEMRLLGQALALLREGQNLTQEEAGANCRPPFSKQAWYLHEAGRVKGILTPDVQRRLVTALGLTLEDLRLARERLVMHGSQARATARAVGGLRERASRAYEAPLSAGRRHATFPLPEGEVMISWPEHLSADSLADLESYLATFLRTVRLKAAN